MGYVLLGILVLGLVATIVAAVMNSKTEPQTWPIYQAILLVFVFIGGGVFFYLGARTLATHRNWRERYQASLQQATSLESQLLPLEGGMSPEGRSVEGEIPRLKREVSLAVDARGGGVYYDVKAGGIEDGVVELTLSPPGSKPPAAGAPPEGLPVEPPAEPPAQPGGDEQAAPAATGHGLVANTVLFAFDQTPAADGGRYLGEFKVTEAAPDSSTFKVAPNLPLTDAQATRLATAAEGTWTLYTMMPPDSARVFTQMDAAKREAMLPGGTAETYAQADRPLHDFYTFFHENYVQRAQLANAIAIATSKISRAEADTQEAAKEAGYRQTEKENLQSDLKSFQSEVAAITAYDKSLTGLLAEVRNQLKATYIENRRAAQTLTREQLKAAREIDRRSSAAARPSS